MSVGRPSRPGTADPKKVGREVAVAETVTLESWLDQTTAAAGDEAAAACEIVLALTEAGRAIAELLAAGPLAGSLAVVRKESGGGDAQKELDLRAHDLVVYALRGSPAAAVLSEEAEAPEPLTAGAPLVVAVDPLDGSSNIDTNVPVGTIFSILPALDAALPSAFLQPGWRQLAAGFLIYGPQTALVLSFGDGTAIFTREPASGRFLRTAERATIPSRAAEYAINGANERHWEEPVRLYVADCQAGAAGPRGVDFNTRWIAALVADAYRIMVRGGVYLYPADARPGYGSGRLRLIYEANPIALLVEQAGGAASDGRQPILDIVPTAPHQRSPLVFGAREEVAEVARYYHDPLVHAARAPLFGTRSLYRVSGN